MTTKVWVSNLQSLLWAIVVLTALNRSSTTNHTSHRKSFPISSRVKPHCIQTLKLVIKKPRLFIYNYISLSISSSVSLKRIFRYFVKWTQVNTLSWHVRDIVRTFCSLRWQWMVISNTQKYLKTFSTVYIIS